MRLAEYCMPVWALIGQYQATGRDPLYVATTYRSPVDAMQAVLAYYRQYAAVIDARLEANVA